MAPLVIGPTPDEDELTPVYLPAPVEKEPAPLMIGAAPDEKELTPVYLPNPQGEGAGPPGDWASPL